MNGNFWTVFTAVAVVSSAFVWKFAPEAGQKLPASVRNRIYDSVRMFRPGASRAEVRSGDIVAPATPPVETAAPVPAVVAAPKPAAAAVPAKSKSPVPGKPAKAGSESPYLGPAAKALREYRTLSASLEKNRKRMGLAEQRAAMKKLHELNERVEFLNRKHREWKASHPAGSGR